VLIESKAYTSSAKFKRRILQKRDGSSVRIIEGAGADEGGPSVPGTDEGGPRRDEDARVST